MHDVEIIHCKCGSKYTHYRYTRENKTIPSVRVFHCDNCNKDFGENSVKMELDPTIVEAHVLGKATLDYIISSNKLGIS